MTTSAGDLEEPLLPSSREEENNDAASSSPSTPGQQQQQASNNDVPEDDGVQDDSKNIVIRLPPSPCCGLRRQRTLRLNHNVFLNLVLSVLYGMSDSLWSGTVLAAYLKRLGHDENRPVGYIEAVNGLAVLFSALPVGYLADVYGRDKLIRAGGVLFIVTAMLHATLMAYWIGTDETRLSEPERQTALILLGVVMGLWGIGGGIVSGPCQALYADSTPAGDRSRYYHYLFVSYLSSSCLGPVVSIILFQRLGNDWTLRQLGTIIYVGLALEAGNALLMMLFDDTKALDEDEDDELEISEDSTSTTTTTTTPAPPGPLAQPEQARVDADNDEKGSGTTTAENLTVSTASSDAGSLTQSLLTAAAADEEEERAAGGESSSSNSEVSPRRLHHHQQQKPGVWKIPYILFGSSLIFSVGSGMTVKFFPLFFKEDAGMSPSQVQAVYVLVPLFMAAFSGVGTALAPTLGRVQTTLLFDVLGIVSLYAMVAFQTYLDAHPLVLVPLYIFRTSIMNSPYPLIESILMDFVPKRERARWKSLESIAQFGWCGSAALGGWISDRSNYTKTFFCTATIQVLGTLLFATLLPLVPRREAALANEEEEDNDDDNEDRRTRGRDAAATTTAEPEPS